MIFNTVTQSDLQSNCPQSYNTLHCRYTFTKEILQKYKSNKYALISHFMEGIYSIKVTY